MIHDTSFGAHFQLCFSSEPIFSSYLYKCLTGHVKQVCVDLYACMCIYSYIEAVYVLCVLKESLH